LSGCTGLNSDGQGAGRPTDAVAGAAKANVPETGATIPWTTREGARGHTVATRGRQGAVRTLPDIDGPAWMAGPSFPSVVKRPAATCPCPRGARGRTAARRTDHGPGTDRPAARLPDCAKETAGAGDAVRR